MRFSIQQHFAADKSLYKYAPMLKTQQAAWSVEAASQGTDFLNTSASEPMSTSFTVDLNSTLFANVARNSLPLDFHAAENLLSTAVKPVTNGPAGSLQFDVRPQAGLFTDVPSIQVERALLAQPETAEAPPITIEPVQDVLIVEPELMLESPQNLDHAQPVVCWRPEDLFYMQNGYYPDSSSSSSSPAMAKPVALTDQLAVDTSAAAPSYTETTETPLPEPIFANDGWYASASPVMTMELVAPQSNYAGNLLELFQNDDAIIQSWTLEDFPQTGGCLDAPQAAQFDTVTGVEGLTFASLGQSDAANAFVASTGLNWFSDQVTVSHPVI